MTGLRSYPVSLRAASPGLIALVLLAGGFVTVALAFFIGIGDTVAVHELRDGSPFVKHVGFGSAFNWSMMLTLLLPAAALYLVKIFQSFTDTVHSLQERHMIVKDDLTPLSAEDVKHDWERTSGRYRGFLFILLLLALVFSLAEWVRDSATPLFLDDVSVTEEWDWSIGVLFDSEGNAQSAPIGVRATNALVSLIAFLGQAVLLAVILCFLYHAIIVSMLMARYSLPEDNTRLLPDLGSLDRRRGFEVLGPFLEQSLLLTAIVYATFYLSRVQNIYLRSADANIVSFIANDMVRGLITNPFDLGAATEAVRAGVEVGDKPLDYSSAMVSLGAFAIMIIAAFLVAVTARDAARRSCQEVTRRLRDDVTAMLLARRYGLESAAEAIDRARTMVYWPVDYLRARTFFGLLVFGSFCILFYRLGLIILGWILLKLMWEIGRYIFAGGEATGD